MNIILAWFLICASISASSSSALAEAVERRAMTEIASALQIGELVSFERRAKCVGSRGEAGVLWKFVAQRAHGTVCFARDPGGISFEIDLIVTDDETDESI